MARPWTSDPVIWIGGAVAVLFHAWALFAGAYLPYIDWSNHLGLISVLAHGGESGALAYAERSLAPTPYLLFYAVAAAFAQLVAVDVAAKLGLLVATFLMTLGAAALAEACGRSPRLGLVAPMALYGLSMGYGFASFVFSMPILLFVLAAAERLAVAEDERLSGKTMPLAALLALAYIAHALVFLPGSLVIWIRMTVAAVAQRRSRLLLHTALAFVPAALFALPAFARFAAVPEREAGTVAAGGAKQLLGFEDPLSTRLQAMGGHLLERGSTDHWTTMYLVGLLFVFVLALGFGLGLRGSKRGPLPPRSHGLELYAAFFSALYFFGPSSIEWPAHVWMVYPRYATLAALLLFLLPRTDLGGRLGLVFAAVALGLVGHNAWLNAKHVENFSSLAAPYDGVRRLVPPGSRVLALTVVPAGDLTQRHQALGSLYFYHLVDGAAYSAFLFDNALLPVRLKPDHPKAPFWRSPSSFDPRTHGVEFDHLVLRGQSLVERTKQAGLHSLLGEVHGWFVFATKNPGPWPPPWGPPQPR